MSLTPALSFTSLIALMTAALLLAAPSLAENADRDKPINVESDRMVYDDVKQVSTFTGKVVLTKGTLEIRGDRLTVRTEPDGSQTGTAWGDLASFRQKREGIDEWVEGQARQIDYDGRLETIRLQQQAMVRRTAQDRVLDEVYGNDILYESRTEFFTVEGGGATGATPANPSGRVRVVIQPRATQPAPAEPPARLEPAERLDSGGASPKPGAASKPGGAPRPVTVRKPGASPAPAPSPAAR